MTQSELTEPTGAAADFGELLRQHRLAAGLTQDSLAELAGLSVHGIQKLESGSTHPYRDTAERLIRALQLRDQDQARFKLAARPAPRRSKSVAATLGTPTRTNLPISATSFVARAKEIESVKERLRHSRLLTLNGSGGCGKTRLALEVARQLESDFADGVWLVDLAPLTDASLVAQTIATTLGIRDEPGRLVIDALTEYLRNRHVLLILDNCEHLIDACAQVVDLLLRSCAHVQVLATSRELFGVAGEATWRVASLSVANRQDLADGSEDWAANVRASESGRLFFDRAQLVVHSFAITAQNAPAVAQVCRCLDGIPLAIELAAARLSMLSVDQIASRLDQRFRLLAGGSRTAVRRQQTLQATIDWSYQLLSEEERSLLRRLAVFAGGWSLEAAEALGADPLQPREDVFELLSRLVAKSMVVVEKPLQNEPRVLRYRFLETIRQYAEERLVDAAKADHARTRHRDWYLWLAGQAMDGMEGADQTRWWARLDLEHDTSGRRSRGARRTQTVRKHCSVSPDSSVGSGRRADTPARRLAGWRWRWRRVRRPRVPCAPERSTGRANSRPGMETWNGPARVWRKVSRKRGRSGIDGCSRWPCGTSARRCSRWEISEGHGRLWRKPSRLAVKRATSVRLPGAWEH